MHDKAEFTPMRAKSMPQSPDFIDRVPGRPDLMNVEPTSMTQILGSMSVVSCSILIRPFSMTGY